MNIGKWKGNYFVCLEFSFHDSSYYSAFSLNPHSSVYSKNYIYPLEQDCGLKKIS